MINYRIDSNDLMEFSFDKIKSVYDECLGKKIIRRNSNRYIFVIMYCYQNDSWIFTYV
jgi:hypothetical protein